MADLATNEARHRSARWWVSFVLAGLLLFGAVGAVYATQARRPVLVTPKAKPHLSLTVKTLGGQLTPGIKHVVRVKIKNGFGYRVKITNVSLKPRTSSVAACRTSWFATTKFAVKKKAPKQVKPILLKAHKTATVKLSVTLKNLKSVNQDACKHSKLTLTATAKARR
jgi:hypothetical protein